MARSADLAGPVLDELLDQVDQTLVARQHVEAVQVARAFTDPRRARRTSRRTSRIALQVLPTRFSDESEAA